MTRALLDRHKLLRLRRLSPAERRALLLAAAWLLVVDLGLRTLGFVRLRRLLGRGPASAPGGADGAAPARRREAESLGRLVAAAASHHLYPMTCLPRSLVLWHLLARRGLPAELRIGVRKGGGSFDAHAWVEVDGEPVGESARPNAHFASLALPAPHPGPGGSGA